MKYLINIETTSNDFFESTTGALGFANYESNFYLQAVGSPEPDDDGSDEEEDKGNGSDDGEPPLDEDVVHSPVPPRTGGPP